MKLDQKCSKGQRGTRGERSTCGAVTPPELREWFQQILGAAELSVKKNAVPGTPKILYSSGPQAFWLCRPVVVVMEAVVCVWEEEGMVLHTPTTCTSGTVMHALAAACAVQFQMTHSPRVGDF